MKIICGLGNPGKLYELTHHNMGFLAIDELAERLNIKVNKLKFKALLGEGRIGDEKVILVKPQTYMNLSGEALRPIMEFYKASPADLMVIYDDIDLPLGAIRVRGKGSSGSHNGMKSIIYQLQYDNFPRCRIGLGDHGQIPLDKFVLAGITDLEAPILRDAVSRAADAAECWTREGIAEAMARYNAKERKEKKPEAKEETKEQA